MSYKKVESVNRAIAGTFTPALTFDVGRISDFNIHTDSASVPICWMVPREYTASPMIEKMNRFEQTHIVELYFYKRTQMSDDNDEIFQIIKDMDAIATEFYIKLQDFADSNDLEVNSFSISPQYFNHAKGLVSGVLLNYNLVMPDDFEYC